LKPAGMSRGDKFLLYVCLLILFIGFFILPFIPKIWFKIVGPQNKTLVGEGFLLKSSLPMPSDKFQGSIEIKTIQVGKYDSSADREIVILADNQCLIFDEKTHKLKKTIMFKKRMGIRPELIKIKKDGSLEIMRRGGGFGDIGLTGTDGEFIWKYKQVGTSPYMAAGDLDGDGHLEFYVADYDGVHRLDYSGREIWRTYDGVWEEHIQTCNVGGSKTSLIITSGNRGMIRIRNYSGKLIKEMTPKMEVYSFEVVKWPDNCHILTNDGNRIIVIDLDGKIILQYEYEKEWFTKISFLRSSFEIFDIRGVPVKLDAKEEPYLAVITDFRSYISRAMLNIFSPSGKLVYQELLNSTRAISAIDNPDGSQGLIVGDGPQNVWIYDKKK